MGRIRLIKAQSLEFVSELFARAGCSKAQADIVADHLTKAEMRGLASHGLSRIPFYTKKLRAGGYKTAPNFSVLRETASTALVDADDGIGAVSGTFAMRTCIEKARSSGCAAVAVTHANHIGFLGYYTMMAAKENMIGLTICNSGACVSVWGTNERVLGTDPLSIAIPAKARAPIVFDAATSVVAQGKVAVAAIEKKPIPDTWACDGEGNPTSDPETALEGAMRPFGGYKGSGLAMVIALVTAGLGGVAFDMEKENLKRINEDNMGSDLADMFMAINIQAFTDVEAFKHRADDFIDTIKSFSPAPGFGEILMPGEIEYKNTQKAEKEGFTIDRNLLGELEEVARALGYKYDFSKWPEE